MVEMRALYGVERAKLIFDNIFSECAVVTPESACQAAYRLTKGGKVATVGLTTQRMTVTRRPSASSLPKNSGSMVATRWEPLFWGFCIFLLTSPFAYQLIGADPSAEVARDAATMRRTEGSNALLYALRYVVACCALAALLVRGGFDVLKLTAMAPAMCFLAWAILSLAWTDSFSSSFNGVLALIPLLVTGFCLAARLEPILFARSFVYSGIFVVVFSITWVFVFPQYGLHNITDASQSVHAGAWRGVYPHKNLLGGVAAVGAVMTLLAGRSVFPSRIARAALLAGQVFLILKTTSATAVGILILTPALTWFCLCIGGQIRLLLFLLGAPVVALLASNMGRIFELFGRDATLTGRTGLWEFAPDAIAQRPIAGFGYASTTYGEFMVTLLKQYGMFDPHNGYLNMLLGTGLVGFILFFTMIGFFANVARRMYLNGVQYRSASIVMFSVIAAWLIAMMTESQDKPLGSFAALGFTVLGGLVYRARHYWKPAQIRLRQRPAQARP